MPQSAKNAKFAVKPILSKTTATTRNPAHRDSMFEDFQVDTTEMKPAFRHKYLLIVVCTYFEWIEAKLTKTEKA